MVIRMESLLKCLYYTVVTSSTIAYLIMHRIHGLGALIASVDLVL